MAEAYALKAQKTEHKATADEASESPSSFPHPLAPTMTRARVLKVAVDRARKKKAESGTFLEGGPAQEHLDEASP